MMDKAFLLHGYCLQHDGIQFAREKADLLAVLGRSSTASFNHLSKSKLKEPILLEPGDDIFVAKRSAKARVSSPKCKDLALVPL